jgi:ribose/xylose/arabinose/galactoside ABC-type transport system permease subunit
MNPKKLILGLLENITWILLATFLIVFAVISDRFLTSTNLISILIHASVLGIMVIGQSVTLISGNFDLSSESTLGLTALLGAWLVAPAGGFANGSGWGVHPFAATALMMVAGLFIGWLNGNLITRLKMNNFVVTLAMLIVVRGIMLGFTKGDTVTKMPDLFRALGHDKIGPIPLSVITMLVAFVIAYVVFRYRRFGRDLYAIGGNQEAALASGIDPKRRIRQAYLVSGILAAFAGWMEAGRLGAIVAGLGEGMIFEVQAAAVIGGISLFGGRGTMLGALGGCLLLAVIDSGLHLARVSVFWIQAVRGMVILVAMVIDAQRVRIST